MVQSFQYHLAVSTGSLPIKFLDEWIRAGSSAKKTLGFNIKLFFKIPIPEDMENGSKIENISCGLAHGNL